MKNFLWAGFFMVIAAALATLGYGYVHDATLAVLIIGSFLASVVFSFRYLDEGKR